MSRASTLDVLEKFVKVPLATRQCIRTLDDSPRDGPVLRDTDRLAPSF